jgi:hypothetical protein
MAITTTNPTSRTLKVTGQRRRWEALEFICAMLSTKQYDVSWLAGERCIVRTPGVGPQGFKGDVAAVPSTGWEKNF